MNVNLRAIALCYSIQMSTSTFFGGKALRFFFAKGLGVPTTTASTKSSAWWAELFYACQYKRGLNKAPDACLQATLPGVIALSWGCCSRGLWVTLSLASHLGLTASGEPTRAVTPDNTTPGGHRGTKQQGGENRHWIFQFLTANGYSLGQRQDSTVGELLLLYAATKCIFFQVKSNFQ